MSHEVRRWAGLFGVDQGLGESRIGEHIPNGDRNQGQRMLLLELHLTQPTAPRHTGSPRPWATTCRGVSVVAMSKSVLVTGAATGIGRAIALKFASNGYRVGAFDVDDAGLATLIDEAHDAADIVTGHMDVRSATDWQQALDSFVGDGGLDILVNNAGILQSGQFAQIPLADQTRTVEVNVIGVITGCHTAHPYLKQAGGQVINLCSASAVYGQSELATYSATKFAVRGLSEALDLEWAPDGIRVSALWPLFVKTNMTDDMDIGTTRALGIRLTADDVAQAAWDVAHSTRQLSPHHGVGIQSQVSMAAANLAPASLTRLINKYLASR